MLQGGYTRDYIHCSHTLKWKLSPLVHCKSEIKSLQYNIQSHQWSFLCLQKSALTMHEDLDSLHRWRETSAGLLQVPPLSYTSAVTPYLHVWLRLVHRKICQKQKIKSEDEKNKEKKLIEEVDLMRVSEVLILRPMFTCVPRKLATSRKVDKCNMLWDFGCGALVHSLCE